jgi:hypothetical protein
MKPALGESSGGRPARVQSILTVGWMLLVLGGFVLIRMLGSQTFHVLHFRGKVQ